MRTFVLAVALMAVVAADAFAWRRGRRAYYYPTYSSSSLTYRIDTEKRFYAGRYSLQDLAMIRAKWMAHYGVMTHGIHGYHKNCPAWPGEVSEGIGCGGPKCSTCVTGSVCVADAEWKSKSGMTYRVRFFKNR